MPCWLTRFPVLRTLTSCGLIRFGRMLPLASPSGFQNPVIHSQHRLLGLPDALLPRALVSVPKTPELVAIDIHFVAG